MKKLSIEEKAKAYDEALEKIYRFIDGYSRREISKEELENIFPELKESEDERIRKELIEFVKSRGGFKQEYIAWLEKQGEHANFRNKIQIGDKVTRNEDGVLVNLSQLKRVAKKDEKQGEQKQELLTKEKALKNSPFVEQKSAEWSEDDQSNFCELRSFIVETYRAEDASKLITWLESLKDRVQPQPMQEWSEEDERMLQGIIDDVKQHRLLNEYQLGWLSELRPQNKWKPSDEQMKALANALSLAKNCGEEYSFDLRTLYEQLKKL